MSEDAKPDDTPARRGALSRLLIPLVVLAAFGGGVAGGWSMRPAGESESAPVPEPEAGEIDIGTYLLPVPGRPPVSVSIKVTGVRPPSKEAARDEVIFLLRLAAQAPLVSAQGFDHEAASKAVMAMAPQEAPWLRTIRIVRN